MANSKSNIYPIQLQGAELNLNKYDAEIKQYSGFNKNNSPFVGGCLSNVFTKERVIPGGNDDNVYIDTNGDVYRVDTNGFYKNDERLVTYDNNTKFFEKRVLKAPSNAVKALDENIYITEENGNFIAHWGRGFSKILGPSQSDEDLFLDINEVNGCLVFSLKRYSWNLYLWCTVYWIAIIDKNEEHNTSSLMSMALDIHLFDQSGFYRFYPHGVYIKDMGNNDDFYIFIAMNEDNGGLNYQTQQTGNWRSNGFHAMYIKRSHPQAAIEESHDAHIIAIPEGFPSHYFLASEYICSYYMTNDGVFHFTHLPYTMDSSTYRTRTCPNSNFVFCINIRLSINFYHSQGTTSWSQYVESVQDSLWCNGGSTPGVTSLVGSTFRNRHQKPQVYYKNVKNCLSQYGVTFNNQFLRTDNENYGFVMSWADRERSVATERDTGTVIGTYYKYGLFKILVNNGEISNVSVKCSSNKGGILCEEWNKVSDVVITSSGDRMIYKSDGIFYEIVETNKPRISKKLNQLVVNCNYELNSYNLVLSKLVKFADDWNCAYIGYTIAADLNYIFFNGSGSGSHYYIASAVNEYERELNPSIILNARDVGGLSTDINILKYIQSAMDRNPVCAVNIYGAVDSANAVYICSCSNANEKRRELVGLPFPNNTDGNVPYNPNLFSQFISNFGTDVFVRNNNNTYQLMKEGQDNIMSFFLGTLIEGLELVFILQGQYYGVINNMIFGLTFANGVISNTNFIVNIQGLQFCGNTPYEALFYSKTNRCLYSFTGANVLGTKQLIDKVSEVRNYLYNPATQTVFLITDVGVFFYGIFGQFLIEHTNVSNVFLLDNGIVFSYNNGNYRYVKYYLDNGDSQFVKEHIRLETCFYGMNDQTVTINDCLYFRLFSEEHEAGELKVSATTLSLEGRKTEETTFKIKSSDWDKLTHTIYLRYQPKEQRGLGVSFLIDSPFKIAAMSVGSQADSILVDKVSKGAINAPQQTSNNTEW